jgi:hypothetical protein
MTHLVMALTLFSWTMFAFITGYTTGFEQGRRLK